MKQPGILITQCLQNDFVQPLERYDPLPNMLHVGYEEAHRLLGEHPGEGPVSSIMDWAYAVPDDKLTIIHIRDWHDDGATAQHEHLEHFGAHCIQNTMGGDFVFRSSIKSDRAHHIVDASGLNDFHMTNLGELLRPFAGKQVRIGIIGVWTEAKISYLAYELRTRYPEFEVALCSALTASSTRTMHFVALDQMKGILGLQVFSSVGAFTTFLAGSMPAVAHEKHPRLDTMRLHFEDDYQVSETDMKLLLYLFRDCKEVNVRCLDGGFSGNVVLKARSTDVLGHRQVPCVIKAGDRDMIAKERTSFERIQEVLGNNAPSIVDFAEIDDRGAIKYRYAAMLDGNVHTLQHIYADASPEDVSGILDTVFIKQLGRLYDAAVYERLNLLEYYDFSPRYAESVSRRVAALLGHKPSGDRIQLLPDIDIPNVCDFYARDLLSLKEYGSVSHYMAYLHGDLNGRNIIIDEQNNVWLIDFFHTHHGHIIKDLVKLENDIQFIWTPVESDEQLREAIRLTDLLIDGADLAIPPDPEAGFVFPQFTKAFRTIAHLRSFYPRLVQSDRDPYQLYVGLMRYAMHTISFDESSLLQKKWALYCGARCGEKIKEYIVKSRELRIDYIRFPKHCSGSKLGITILPGRRDRDRNIAEDIQAIKGEGITAVMCLITPDEFQNYGVPDLMNAYASAGFKTYSFPIRDQGAPARAGMKEAAAWLDALLEKGECVLVHCVGGLGRSGTVAACYLVEYCRASPDDAVDIVRKSRSERAIESREQLGFIYQYCENK